MSADGNADVDENMVDLLSRLSIQECTRVSIFKNKRRLSIKRYLVRYNPKQNVDSFPTLPRK